MILFALTIFASAFLLFLVQPIIAKQILPWFGGSAAVWTTCLVFFQTALLAGYAYADVVVRRIDTRKQVLLHGALLAASLLLLPIVPGAFWKPSGTENPAALILGLLTVTLGLPYFLLSTTSPLLQAWFARRYPGRNPYRLFALSNLASLLALVGYPFLLEPWVPTRTQALAWSVGYGTFVVLCAATAWTSLRGAPRATTIGTGDSATFVRPAGPPPPWSRSLLWCGLAATGSVLLLSVTNHITQNIAAVPLLWIVPLTLYLLTFILCFDSSRWYPRELLLPVTAATLGVMAWCVADTRLTHELELQLGVFCIGLFIACMFCHGELARQKPAPAYLTRFYLMVSLGGAIGAALVGILAPLVLQAHFELGLRTDRRAPACSRGRCAANAIVFGLLALVSVIVTVGCAIWSVVNFYESTIVTARNFYGVLRVQETGVNEVSKHRSLVHGTIMHGLQYLAPQFNRQATSYYTETSGHRPAARDAASAQGTAASRRHRPRNRHARVVWHARRPVSLLRHQSGRDPHRPARTSRIWGKAKRPSRRRSVTRA